MRFAPGQLVRCVDDDGARPALRRGALYRVVMSRDAFVDVGVCPTGHPYPGFLSVRFRPATNIEPLRRLLDTRADRDLVSA